VRGAAHLGSTLSLHQPRVSVYHVTSIPQLCPSTAPLLCHSTHAVSACLQLTRRVCVPPFPSLHSPALLASSHHQHPGLQDDLRLIHRTHSRRQDEQGEHPRPRVWPHRVLVTSLVSAPLTFISTGPLDSKLHHDFHLWSPASPSLTCPPAPRLQTRECLIARVLTPTYVRELRSSSAMMAPQPLVGPSLTT
jgi:hypothetical protein